VTTAEPARQRAIRRKLAVTSIVLAVLLLGVGIGIMLTKEAWYGGILPIVLGVGILIYFAVAWRGLRERELI
jgi:hypothetical protein